MENIIKITPKDFCIVVSPALQQAVIVIYNINSNSHITGGVLHYKNLSRQYISHFMEQKKLTNFVPINLDEAENNKCYLIAEDLEENKDVLVIFKNKKELVIDTPFEEAPPIPEGINI